MDERPTEVEVEPKPPRGVLVVRLVLGLLVRDARLVLVRDDVVEVGDEERLPQIGRER